ncbi:antibiotic biosynthesis monooxygenase [Lentiprolixibacter aurantiacus]|uniref:Antibiotic biosynthesis monooxygenase n=1 Tax=Lentiprolixibacter aurantiacus TaxID=2993939 RepID=A0AAE3SMC0_9FLAO|nr:antibiotic biosynthesis monooxygenase [Lentiprolixibacter aurantiacus]MCX2718126.1 antibiotic biosynthesis monooxygenase [Lentiprolixibacter aurantiacus]
MATHQKIIRTWSGWTTLENASAYEKFLVEEVFLDVKKKGVDGLEKVSISTLTHNEEVQFFLVLQFSTLEAVKKFAGENYKMAYIPEKAKQLLKRYDHTAKHFELKQELLL